MAAKITKVTGEITISSYQWQIWQSTRKTQTLARGFNTSNLQKPKLQELLTEELKGAQRVPSLLVLNLTQSLKDLNLTDYEILDCEPTCTIYFNR